MMEGSFAFVKEIWTFDEHSVNHEAIKTINRGRVVYWYFLLGNLGRFIRCAWYIFAARSSYAASSVVP